MSTFTRPGDTQLSVHPPFLIFFAPEPPELANALDEFTRATYVERFVLVGFFALDPSQSSPVVIGRPLRAA